MFIFPNDGSPLGNCVSLHPLLKTAEERTSAVGYVVEHLGEERIPGIRNEVYDWNMQHFVILFYAFLIPNCLVYVSCPCFSSYIL